MGGGAVYNDRVSSCSKEGGVQGLGWVQALEGSSESSVKELKGFKGSGSARALLGSGAQDRAPELSPKA